MLSNIHPKTAGAGLGAAIGTILVSILASIHGVHLSSADNGGIVAALSVILAWFAPASPTVPVVVQMHPPAADPPPTAVAAVPAAPAPVPPGP